jgi:hypothetical protein
MSPVWWSHIWSHRQYRPAGIARFPNKSPLLGIIPSVLDDQDARGHDRILPAMTRLTPIEVTRAVSFPANH